MSIHRKLMTGCAVAVLGFGLAACGGGGDSSDDERDSLRMQIAALEAALPEGTELTPAAITQLTDDLTAATADVTRLMDELETAMDNSADEAEILRLMGELETATADVTRLMGELETAMDNSADEAEIARLMGELETLMMRADITPAQVQALRDQITALMATTPEDVLALNQQITSLTEQLGTATADVTRLEGELETALDNSADEAEIARLTGELETATADVTRLMGELETALDNSADEAEIARLMGELETAMDNSADEAEIARLTGELETLMMRADITPAQVQALRDQITALMATTPEDVRVLNQQITSLIEQLGTATADVTRLEGELQTAMDNSADEAEILRLMGELETAMDNSADEAEILRLMGELATAMDNSADEAEIARLEGELATAVDNSADEAEIARLEGELATAVDNSADEAEILRLMGELATAMDNSADEAEILRLEGELATAMDNSADEAEILRLTGLLDTATKRVTALETQIGSMDDEADASETASLHAQLKAAKAEVDRIQMAAAEALAEAAAKERIARELGIRTAINLVGNRVGTSAKAFPNGITELAATRDAAGTVMIDVNGDSDDVYAGGEVAASSGAWTSATLTKTDVGTEAIDTLVIYTDIEEPADKLFTEQYTQAVRDDIFQAPARLKLARASGFPSGPSVEWTYDGTPDGRAKTFPGTFDGVAGQFACTSDADCTLATNTKGELSTSAGDWRFTPMSPLTATVKDPDVAYAYFGWWLNKPKANDATHDVEVFAGGTENHFVNIGDVIVGNASYTGPAAGKYVTKSYTAGVHTDSGVGHFTATASLAAKFGGNGEAGTIGGTIGGFTLDDERTVPWSVKLEDADLDTSTPFDGTTEVNFGGGFTATEIGAGTWQGSFYDAADDPADAPGTVAGTFDAVTENASVIGGFGATKQ